jgi:mannosyltransferase
MVTEGMVGFTAPVEQARPSAAFTWRLAPVGVALGSLCISTVVPWHQSVTTDEATSIAQAHGSLSSVLSTVVHDNPGSAGHLLLLRLVASVGTDERTVRVPSAIAVALAAALLVVLGTLMLGRLAGLVAGIALASNAAVVDASREARPYALGLFGIVLATLLVVVALERGGGWRWIPYGAVAALLPLTHPLAASVLAAHGAALIAYRGRSNLRHAGIALLAGTTVAGLLLAWMAADRFGDPDGAGSLDLERLGRGLLHAVGWNPILFAAAVAGLVILLGAFGPTGARWHGVLVAALIGAPIVATLLAAITLPIFPGALVLCAPGIALAAGAVAPLLSPTRGLVWAGIALLLVSSGATIAWRLSSAPAEDWRGLARAVKRVRLDRETVVVVPERSRDAFAYYAPDVQMIRYARGDGAWVAVVAGTPGGAIEAARPLVNTPRYALLRQFRYGDNLRLQHWVRP